jgi:hypothetical protein
MSAGENKPIFPFIAGETAPDCPQFESPRPHRGPNQLVLSLLPGSVLIILGGLFLLSHYGFLSGEWWQYFLVGLGVILIVESRLEYRFASPGAMRMTRLAAGLVLILGGLLFLFNPNGWWPLAVMGIGIVLLIFPLIKYYKQK